MTFPPTSLPIPRSPEFDELAAGAQFRDLIAVRVAAEPEALFRALRVVTLADMPLARLVGGIRYLPTRLAGRLPRADTRKPFLSSIVEGGTLVLRDRTPREIITGSAGRLHRIVDQTPVLFPSRSAFDTFTDPDHEKLFMSIRVTDAGPDGTRWLVLEHATRALSPAAEKKFRRYWLFIRPGGAFVTRQLLSAIGRRARSLDARRRRAPDRKGVA